MTISFTTTDDETKAIDKIVDRVLDEIPQYGDRLDIHMDVTACHCNGTPLDLEKMLKAPAVDFANDVLGIRRHIDRRTGKIGNCFLPRCAQKACGL